MSKSKYMVRVKVQGCNTTYPTLANCLHNTEEAALEEARLWYVSYPSSTKSLYIFKCIAEVELDKPKPPIKVTKCDE